MKTLILSALMSLGLFQIASASEVSKGHVEKPKPVITIREIGCR